MVSGSRPDHDSSGLRISEPVDLVTALSLIDEPWSPETVAVLNDYDIRVVKTKGEFTRHSHPETDEVFIVLDGSRTIRLDAGNVDPRTRAALRRPQGRSAPAGLDRGGGGCPHRAQRDRQHGRHPEPADGCATPHVTLHVPESPR